MDFSTDEEFLATASIADEEGKRRKKTFTGA
jgi:hypothetical protein